MLPSMVYALHTQSSTTHSTLNAASSIMKVKIERNKKGITRIRMLVLQHHTYKHTHPHLARL